MQLSSPVTVGAGAAILAVGVAAIMTIHGHKPVPLPPQDCAAQIIEAIAAPHLDCSVNHVWVGSTEGLHWVCNGAYIGKAADECLTAKAGKMELGAQLTLDRP
jgi:hypothetical protein